MTTVFLSYARSDDEPFVRRLCDDLTAVGLTVWFDRKSLMARGLTFHQEIKDAIRCDVDRIVYVGGPKAAVSPYVREEWQLGLEFDHVVVTPILRLGDYTDIPGELALLHCEDFRDGVDYNETLAKLIANLQKPNPKLGALVAVPSLPPHFITRPELMRRVRDALLVDLQTSRVMTSEDTSTETHVGMQGMGGIGKSVLAAALARNRRVREAYPDGIVWISFGQKLTNEDLLQRLRDVVHHLGGDVAFTSLPQGQGILRELLQAKAVLLILDDVWKASDAQKFDFLGPRCRMLITTRDAGIVHTLHGERFPVSLFTEKEALELLAESVDLLPAALPPEAHEVVDECGLLPLALALSGGMAKKRGGDFRSVLERLRRSDLDKIADRESFNPQHKTLWRAMQASVEMLSIDEQRRFAELAVFSEDDTVPESTVATLWEHTGRLDNLDTEDLLIDLAGRSLIQLDSRPGTDGTTTRRISLHDLLHDYAVRIAGDAKELNQLLVSAYQEKCPDGWHTGLNDGYFFQHLREHLPAAGQLDELIELVCDLRWVQAKCLAGLTYDLAADYTAALDMLPETQHERDQERQRQERLRNYGAQLVAYAAARGEGVPLPEPPDTRPTHESMRRAEAASQASGPERIDLSRHGRIATFANFVSSHSHQLHRFSEQAIPIAFNHASVGPVADQAEELVGSLHNPWLDREPRPPAPPQHPACMRTFDGHTRSVNAMALTPDGPTAMPETPPEKAAADVVALTPDGLTAVSASFDKTLRVWDVAKGECLRTLEGHARSIRAVAITPDGNTAVSASNDKTLRVWDVATGECLRTLEGRTAWWVWAVALTPDGHTAVSASWDKTLCVWDVATGECERTLEGHTNYVGAVALTPNGHTAVSASWDKTVRVWDVASGNCLRILAGHTDKVCAVALTPDGHTAVSAGADKTLRVWDVAKGECLRTLAGHTDKVCAVALTPDGHTAVSASKDKTLRVCGASPQGNA